MSTRFWLDRTGFPVLVLPQAGLEVHLLPVAKVQFERFLAEPCGFCDAWYEALLAVNPRASYRRFTEANREQLFLTGILSEEALTFARWLGHGFDLPTAEEWRLAYRALDSICLQWDAVVRFLETQGAMPARDILAELIRQQPVSATARDLALMRGGVLEWARHNSDWVGMGSPRQDFFPNLFDPLNSEFRPIKAQERLPHLGFRLIRRGRTANTRS